MKPGIGFAALALWLALAAWAPSCAAPTAWVQMVDGGTEARLITVAGVCPRVMVNHVARPMHERAAPNVDFANRVCAARLPTVVHSLSVEGVALPVPAARPNRLVILGDSGCRLKKAVIQHCNDPAAWPHSAAR